MIERVWATGFKQVQFEAGLLEVTFKVVHRIRPFARKRTNVSSRF